MHYLTLEIEVAVHSLAQRKLCLKLSQGHVARTYSFDEILRSLMSAAVFPVNFKAIVRIERIL